MSSRHQAVLGIFFEEGVTTLSPAHLAYRMGVPVREAEALLDEMVTLDLLALDFSGDHDFGYRLPPGTLPPEPRAPQAHAPASSYGQSSALPHPSARSDASPYIPDGRNQTPYSAFGTDSSPTYGTAAQSWQRTAAPRPASADGTDGSVGPIHAQDWGYAQPQPQAPRRQPTTQPSSPPSPYAASPISTSPFSTSAETRRQELVPFRDNLPQQNVRPDRRPFVAGLLSFLVTGLGQVYNGEPLKGALMFATSAMMWLFMMGWIVSMWSIADAYHVAQRTESQGA